MVAAPFAFIRNADVIGRVTASLQLFALLVNFAINSQNSSFDFATKS
jgi:hypothetical protein